MTRLILSLRENVPDAGDAHAELAESLQNELNNYIPNDGKEDENGSGSDTFGSTSRLMMIEESEAGGHSSVALVGRNWDARQGRQ